MEKLNFPRFAKVILTIIWDFIYLPVWWYSRGFLDLARFFLNLIKNGESSLGFLVWFRNIFVPMYGQSDFAGRLISFVIRFVQIVLRGTVLLLLVLLSGLALLFYLLLPLLIWLAVWHQLT